MTRTSRSRLWAAAFASVVILQSCGGGGGSGGAGSSGGGTGTPSIAVGARKVDRAEFIVLADDGAALAYAGQPVDTTGLPSNTSANLNALLFTVATSARKLVSIDPSGASAGDGLSGSLRMSADGGTVAFTMRARNLVPGITYPAPGGNPLQQLFVRNLTTGVTKLVSVDPSGTGGANVDDVADRFAISSDGRYVAFTAKATNLVANVTYSGGNNVFVRDMVAGTTQIVSIGTDGVTAGCCGGTTESGFPAISADGRYVTFTSSATYLVAGVTYTPNVSGVANVFMRDRTSGTTQLLSISQSGTQASNGGCNVAVVSANAVMTSDASAVAFSCRATNLITGVAYPSNPSDIYLWRRATGSLTLVTRSFDGTEAADNGAAEAVVSQDGRYVAFMSGAFNLVDNVTYYISAANLPVFNVFRWDRVAATTEIVSRSTDGTSGGDFDSQFPLISADGQMVVFPTEATNLYTPAPLLTFSDLQSNAVFWRAATHAVTLASITPSHLPMGSIAPDLALPASGNLIAFRSNVDRSAYVVAP